MKEIQIRCDTKGRIAIDEMHRIEGIDVVLVNEKDIPLAKYSFDSNNIKQKDQVEYSANNYKSEFDVVPTVIFENMPL